MIGGEFPVFGHAFDEHRPTRFCFEHRLDKLGGEIDVGVIQILGPVLVPENGRFVEIAQHRHLEEGGERLGPELGARGEGRQHLEAGVVEHAFGLIGGEFPVFGHAFDDHRPTRVG